ncbi:Serine/threonine-protein kinase ATM, partial [Sesamum angolense]
MVKEQQADAQEEQRIVSVHATSSEVLSCSGKKSTMVGFDDHLVRVMAVTQDSIIMENLQSLYNIRNFRYGGGSEKNTKLEETRRKFAFIPIIILGKIVLNIFKGRIKLLNTWLEGERSVGFCRYLSEKSSMIKPNEIPHSETWPFLVKILIQCLSLEISSSKKRSPKLNFAKTLRILVQRAEDGRSSGKICLLPVARLLFSHVWDVLKDVPIFQSEYGVILRHLLSVKDYRFHMRRRVYCNLVLLYMEKVEMSLSVGNIGQLNPKEDVFRFTLTLQSLLENPPGDIPDELREDMIKGFCYFFSCKLQLSLARGVADGTALLEQLLDVVSKELDQMSTYSPSVPRNDSTRDVKCGLLTSSQLSIVELAALVFCRACTNTPKTPTAEKRARREDVVVLIKERLMEGKWS